MKLWVFMVSMVNAIIYILRKNDELLLTVDAKVYFCITWQKQDYQT